MEARISDKNSEADEFHSLLHRMVLDDDKNTVESIIEANPALLLKRKLVVDHHGLRFEATPLQLAFATLNIKPYEDQKLWLERVRRSLLKLPMDTTQVQSTLATMNFKFDDDEEEDMIEMIHRHLLKLPDGEREFRRQFNEWFPDSWMEDRRLASKVLQSQVEKLTLLFALKCEGYERVALSMQVAFKEYLDEQLQSTIVKSGIYFDPVLMAELIENAINPTCLEKDFWVTMRNIYRNYLPVCLHGINSRDDANKILSKMGRIHDMSSDFSESECEKDSEEYSFETACNNVKTFQEKLGVAPVHIANNPYTTFASSSRLREEELKENFAKNGDATIKTPDCTLKARAQ